MIMEKCIHGIKNPTDCVYCGTMPLKNEIQTLRAKVEVLLEALKYQRTRCEDIIDIRLIDEALATYDKLSEVKK